MPSLNQRTYLADLLQELLKDESYERIWKYTGLLTMGEYKRLLALHYNGKDNEVISEFKKLNF